MNLCIDFGNTMVKVAVYDGDLEMYFYRDKDISNQLLNKLFDAYPITRSIISSTRELKEAIVKEISSRSDLILLTHETDVPLQVSYETPETLGKDRLAGVIGAVKLFPDEHIAVIDAGTCITMDFVHRSGQYLGGNISPGLQMRARAMHEFTDKLPLVEIRMPSNFLGKHTVSAIQNGVYLGAVYEIESFLNRLEVEFETFKIVLTGGDMVHFEEHIKFPIFACSNLVLIGLNEIIKFNDQ